MFIRVHLRVFAEKNKVSTIVFYQDSRALNRVKFVR
ncbi:MAG: hypothetical protein BMS9Abin19_0132 [Gammaproteobacteria bacterium]|nr:MAG: hypothetical protein BMS9Abin19_0132 [Gammaproteobacteria bacterium]